MARITNSNVLRLGSSLTWEGSYSLKHALFLFNYIPYFLERFFFHGVDEALNSAGPLRVHYAKGGFIVIIEIYNLSRPKTRSKFGVQFRTFVLVLLARLLTLSVNQHFVKTKLIFCVKPLTDLDAVFILNYLKLRMLQKFSVMETINSLRRLLLHVPGLIGYRIDVTGRYARQQRAGKLSVKRGVITLSKLDVNITHVADFILLKHGKCGFKVWLNRLPGFTKATRLFQY